MSENVFKGFMTTMYLGEPVMEKKELKQIVAGAILNGVADGAVETVYNNNVPALTNTFPFIRPIEFLPPVDDWLIAGVPVACYLAAKAKKKENIKNVALGAALYGGAMFIHHTIIAINSFLKEQGLSAQTQAKFMGEGAVAKTSDIVPTVAQTPREKTQTLIV